MTYCFASFAKNGRLQISNFGSIQKPIIIITVQTELSKLFCNFYVLVSYIKKLRWKILPSQLYSLVNQIYIYNLCYTLSDIIHPPYPLHLTICFEFFCNVLLCCHLSHKLRKHIFRLLVDVSQVAIQLPAEQQGIVKSFPVSSQVLPPTLTPAGTLSDTVRFGRR